jgi:hypothetical protein
MIEQFKLYLFVLSIIFVLRYLAELIFKFLFFEEPNPIVVTNTKEVFLYLSISYIITFLIL